jgi:aconitate hydratase
MMRGTFANVRIKNRMVPGVEGGVTRHLPSGEQMPIYDAAMRYREEQVPLVVLAGEEYGTGSSRDWAAKGPMLLGVRAVLAKSFERIHRTNLVGMGVVPLEFRRGEGPEALGLSGEETFAIAGLAQALDQTPFQVGREVEVVAKGTSGRGEKRFRAVLRVDTPNEREYVRHGGILQYVLRRLL